MMGDQSKKDPIAVTHTDTPTHSEKVNVTVTSESSAPVVAAGS